jgi:hypothetical protein
VTAFCTKLGKGRSKNRSKGLVHSTIRIKFCWFYLLYSTLLHLPPLTFQCWRELGLNPGLLFIKIYTETAVKIRKKKGGKVKRRRKEHITWGGKVVFYGITDTKHGTEHNNLLYEKVGYLQA